ncbi:MAG TPA: hypothetical protein VL866_24435 [Pyrinomonadaceae bacterium]|nr:hypothetical protein [Pyrinomonadaceae bacterium]
MSDNYAASILCYGSSGTLKTTNVGQFAKYVFEITGAPVRLISADPGGWETIEPFIKAGIIHPYRLTDSKTLLENIRLLMKGHWPTPDGTLGKDPNLDNVGAYAVEGITSISFLILRHLVSKGQKISEDIVGQFREGAEVFGAAGRSHYGFVQQFALDMLGVGGFGSLPTLSKRVMFTAHEGKGQDQQTRQTVYGPAAVGQAITGAIPFYVSDLLHFETAIIDAKSNKTTVRAYLRPHADSELQSIVWPAKPRMPFDQISAIQEKWPEGYIDLSKESLYDYLKFMDSVREKSANSILAWKDSLSKGAMK